MNIKTLVAAVAVMGGLSALPMAADACDMAGPNAHVGMIIQVDPQAHSFTIRDAQTQRPITFQATSDQVKQVSHASNQVLVKYKKDGAKLVAVSIKI